MQPLHCQAPRAADHNNVAQDEYFLGGRDLEMVTIARLVRSERPAIVVHDRRLSWGAHARDYAAEIAACVAAGHTPVLVELQVDEPVDPRWVIVDHHGARAGAEAPTSLQQVFARLGLPAGRWTRELALVSANDRGWIDEMLACGASHEEIARIREEERRVQGITPVEEAEAARAVAAREQPHPRLSVVRAAHDRTAAVTDRLHPALGGPGYDNLLVLGAREANFFGDGALVLRLHAAFGGWTGGRLPGRGYWGCAGVPPEILPALLAWLAAPSDGPSTGLR